MSRSYKDYRKDSQPVKAKRHKQMTPYNRSFRHSTVFDEDLDKYVY
nr:MAG TPA: hypothetical protein [Caudoviricetes sp.]